MLWLLPLLAGAAASYLGERQGANSYQDTFTDALRQSLARRQQALQLAEDQVKRQQPSALSGQMAQLQQPAQAEAVQGQKIADAFAARAGDGSSAGYRGTISGGAANAAAAAGLAGRRAAIGQSFSEALRQRAQGMQQMEMQQGFLGVDQQRADQMLPYDLQRAGQSGANLRMAGQLLSGLGMAGASSSFWKKPAAGAGGASMAGLGGAGATDLPASGLTIDPYTGQLVGQA